MGLRARSTAIAGIAIVALLGPLAPADAASLPPVQAPLLNAAGEPSGCTVRISAPFQFMANDGLREGYGMTVTCDTAWSRLRMDKSKVEVLPGGTIPPAPADGNGSLKNGNTSLTNTLRSNWLCSVTPGTHEYVFRATAKVSTGRGAPNYTAKVARRASFTCP